MSLANHTMPAPVPPSEDGLLRTPEAEKRKGFSLGFGSSSVWGKHFMSFS